MRGTFGTFFVVTLFFNFLDLLPPHSSHSFWRPFLLQPHPPPWALPIAIVCEIFLSPCKCALCGPNQCEVGRTLHPAWSAPQSFHRPDFGHTGRVMDGHQKYKLYQSHCPLWPHFDHFSEMLSNVKLACVSKVRDFFAEAEAKIHLRVKLIFTGRTSHRLSAALLGQPVLECSRTASIQSLSSWDKIATPQTGIYQNIYRNFCTIIPKLKLWDHKKLSQLNNFGIEE